MITIKKKNKINELFTTDGSNIFPYKFDGDYYKFKDSSNNEYYVEIEPKDYGNENYCLSIEYFIYSNNNRSYSPQKEKFNTDKLKVLNTVINICKKSIEQYKPLIIKFSGNIEEGLADLYKMIIRSLKLNKNYDVNQNDDGESINFYLINKKFKFVDCDEMVVAYVPDQGIVACHYQNDGLLINKVLQFNILNMIDFNNFYEVIKFCLPDINVINNNWLRNSKTFVIEFDNYQIDIPKNEIKKVIKYMKSMGINFVEIEDECKIVFQKN